MCYNVYRLRFKSKFRGKKLKGFRKGLGDPKNKIRENFDNARAEYIHQRAGGKCRVRAIRGTVVAKQHVRPKVL